MTRILALIAVLSLAACSVPITSGPRSLNDALLDAHERSEVMPGR